MRHAIDPTAPVMKQLRAIGIPEHLPGDLCMVYRFYASDGRLLYIGVTVSPCNRWSKHRRSAPWWPSVETVRVEWHPHVRAALDAEDAAIKAEMPLCNVRSVPASIVRDRDPIHESIRTYSEVVLPRVGGGGGGRGGVVAHPCLSSHQRRAKAVENADAATTPHRLAWMAASRLIGGGC